MRSSARRHGPACAARCLTRAYLVAAAIPAVLLALHVALGW